jgi:hypothetical protein
MSRRTIGEHAAHARLVAYATEVMRTRRSAFSAEGALRHALRSTLCLQGESWADADAAAAAAVEAALAELGAVRPTPEDAMAEPRRREPKQHAGPTFTCLHCGEPFQADTFERSRKYCSRWCFQAARRTQAAA